MEASCGENEFTLRTRLIYKIIHKENTESLSTKYLKNNFDQDLILRWDNAAEANYEVNYSTNKKAYNFVPLRHEVDSLLKIKAIALLNSPNYTTINNQELALLYLFADDIDSYFDLTKSMQESEKQTNDREAYESHMQRHSFGVYAGYFTPLGTNSYFSESLTAGFSIMTPFTYNFVGELQYKFRIHPNAKGFDFLYKGDIREVKPNTSHVISLGLGYKLLDRNKFIILPKINLGLGFIWTGLSEKEYGEDDQGNETETTRLRNVNTLHSTFGLTFMRKVGHKIYTGIESNLQLIPYQWDNTLKSPIPSKYGSIEFFVRF